MSILKKKGSECVLTAPYYLQYHLHKTRKSAEEELHLHLSGVQ